MTSDRSSGRGRQAYVWTWLPDRDAPVVAGVVESTGDLLASEQVLVYRYGASYLAREDGVSLFRPELPLESGEFDPRRPGHDRQPLPFASCLRDAAPDAWGRRVINLNLGRDSAERLDEVTYLLASGSDRIGALDFQASATQYVARDDGATLQQLMDLAALVEAGEEIPASLAGAALQGTSIGGARPKAVLRDGTRRLVAKFASMTDDWPVVKAEALAMSLAARAGIDTAPVELRVLGGRDVLLVDRFDRPVGDDGQVRRRGMLSMLTILGHSAAGSWGASYADIAQEIRSGPWVDVPATLTEMYRRLVFNILVGNNDDHLRNQAAFWDGANLTLTPAYDVAPQRRSTGTSSQAIAITRDGGRASQLRFARAVAPEFHLDATTAGEIITHLRDSVESNWNDCADQARLTQPERAALKNRQFLNPYIDYDEA